MKLTLENALAQGILPKYEAFLNQMNSFDIRWGQIDMEKFENLLKEANAELTQLGFYPSMVMLYSSNDEIKGKSVQKVDPELDSPNMFTRAMSQ